MSDFEQLFNNYIKAQLRRPQPEADQEARRIWRQMFGQTEEGDRASEDQDE